MPSQEKGRKINGVGSANTVPSAARPFKIKTVKVKGVRRGQLGIFEGYRRWRHPRGYGVHSPYAFNLVTSVVHPGDYSWYGYSDIDRTFPGVVDRKVRREARMLLRLVAELRPRSVFLPSGAHPSFHAAIHAAGSFIQILRKPKQAAEADMICTHGDFIPLDIILAHISRPGRSLAILNAPEGWADRIFEALEEGVLVRGCRNIFATARDGMQKLQYTMKI